MCKVKKKMRCASQGRRVIQVSYLCEIMSISSPHQAMANTTAKNITMSQDKRACSGRRKTRMLMRFRPCLRGLSQDSKNSGLDSPAWLMVPFVNINRFSN